MAPAYAARIWSARRRAAPSRWSERSAEAGEPTGAREHVCGPGVILTANVKGAREGARVKIMLVGCPQTAGWYPPNEVSRKAVARGVRAGRAQASTTPNNILDADDAATERLVERDQVDGDLAARNHEGFFESEERALRIDDRRKVPKTVLVKVV